MKKQLILTILLIMIYWATTAQNSLILQNPQNVDNACVGTGALFTVAATPTEANTFLTFTWQGSSDNGQTWQDLPNNSENYQYDPYGQEISTDTFQCILMVVNIDQTLDSMLYRCVVSESDNNDPTLTYEVDTSQTVHLYLDHNGPTFDLEPMSYDNPKPVYLDSSGQYILTPSDFFITNVQDYCLPTDTVLVSDQGEEFDSITLSCQDLNQTFSGWIRIYDRNGNHTDKPAFITVLDTIGPDFEVDRSSPDTPIIMTVYANFMAFYPVNFITPGSVRDNCSLKDTSFFNPDNGYLYDFIVIGCQDVGFLDTLIIRISDSAGNYTDKYVYIIFLDETIPEIQCTDTFYVTANRPSGYLVQTDTFKPQIINYGCTYVLNNSFNDSTSLVGETLPIGTNTIIWKAINPGFGYDSCQTVIVVGEFANVKKPNTSVYKILPNPASKLLTVTGTSDAQARLRLLDIYGRLIKQINFRHRVDVNIAELKPGIYIIQIISSNGKTYIFKVVKN